MTLQKTGAISLWDIADEFNPGNGHTNVRLQDFYAGGAYVPAGTTNGSGVPIPSSGQLSTFDFYGASAEAAGDTILSKLWANRYGAIRGTLNTSGQNYSTTYPGDVYGTNSPFPFPGVKTDTNPVYNWTFSTTGLAGLSSKSTLFFWMAGSQPQPDTTGAQAFSVQCVDTDGATHFLDSTQAVSIGYNVDQVFFCMHLTFPAEKVSTVQLSYIAQASSNSGSWAGCYVIPGWWEATYDNPVVPNSDYIAGASGFTGFTKTLGNGGLAILVSGDIGSDAGDYYSAPGYNGASGGSLPHFNWTAWWYNAFSQQTLFNYSGTTKTLDYQVKNSSGGYNNHAWDGGTRPVLCILYKNGEVAPTPPPPPPPPPPPTVNSYPIDGGNLYGSMGYFSGTSTVFIDILQNGFIRSGGSGPPVKYYTGPTQWADTATSGATFSDYQLIVDTKDVTFGNSASGPTTGVWTDLPVTFSASCGRNQTTDTTFSCRMRKISTGEIVATFTVELTLDNT